MSIPSQSSRHFSLADTFAIEAYVYDFKSLNKPRGPGSIWASPNLKKYKKKLLSQNKYYFLLILIRYTSDKTASFAI